MMIGRARLWQAPRRAFQRLMSWRAALSDMWPRGWRIFRRVSASYDPVRLLRSRCRRQSRASPTHSTEEVNHAQDHPAGSRDVRVEKDAIPHHGARRRAVFGFHALSRLLPPTAVATLDPLMGAVADSFGAVKVAAPTWRVRGRMEFRETNLRRTPSAWPAGSPNDESFKPARWAINRVFGAEVRHKHDFREVAGCICDRQRARGTVEKVSAACSINEVKSIDCDAS